MHLVDILNDSEQRILDEASESLRRAHLAHYEGEDSGLTRQRLKDLLLLVIRCLAERNLVPICQYSEAVAAERYESGFSITEVQTAFNVLEEAIWHIVIPQVAASDLVEATGLVGTVLGAGKDALARRWVSVATSHHVRSLDLSALFAGTES